MTTTANLQGFTGGAAEFARRGGQLRVSLTPRCQLGCWFCHNEGEVPPRITHHDRTIQPRPRAMTPADYLTAITTLTSAGIRRVFFTGGEPLLSPMARPILEGLPAHRPSDYTTTLITNGLSLTKDLDWLSATALDRIKVSLHYFSNESIAAIAEGKPGDIAKIKAGIEAAIEVIPTVELNLLLQEQNAHEVADIIAYARHLASACRSSSWSAPTTTPASAAERSHQGYQLLPAVDRHQGERGHLQHRPGTQSVRRPRR